MDINRLVGSGDRIGLFTLPFAVVGVIANVLWPSLFDVGGPPPVLRAVSIVIAIVGIAIWIWSAVLIVTKVPRGELITSGPYAVMKHPLYTAVGLLVLPWVGFLADTWLGAVLGVVLYIGSRIYAPAEEASLSRRFGARWESYRKGVKLAWL
jgi:protein-S-isoprenylcysteine O-methyltransferase Ste14